MDKTFSGKPTILHITHTFCYCIKARIYKLSSRRKYIHISDENIIHFVRSGEDMPMLFHPL